MQLTSDDDTKSKDLRNSLWRDAKLKVSLAAARNDLRCISLVERGVRTACLLTTCTAASVEVVDTLRNCLVRYGLLRQSFFLLHTASQQIFIVNRQLLLTNVRDSPTRVYYALNSARPSSLSTMMPGDLQSTLQAIVRALTMKSTQTHNTLILHHPNAIAASGVALAGWLLEYVLIYCHTCPADMPVHATWQDGRDMLQALLSSSDASESSIGLDLSILSQRPLYVFSVFLVHCTTELMQFSIPADLLDEVVRSLPSTKHGAQAIVEHIRSLYEGRLDVLTNAADVIVKYDLRTMAHVTL